MNKNIIIVILVILSFLFGVYAFFQQAAAERALLVAEKNYVLAEEARKEADANAAEAQKQSEIARHEAEQCQQMAKRFEDELAKCRSKK